MWLKELRAEFGLAEPPDWRGGAAGSVFHGRVLLPGKSECRTQEVLHSPELKSWGSQLGFLIPQSLFSKKWGNPELRSLGELVCQKLNEESGY